MKKILAICVILCMLSCKSAKDGFQFEKIAYHTSACFGHCPSYHMEITSNKAIRLKGDSISGRRMGNPDNTRAGYFKGIAPDSTYNKLLKELRTIGLDTVKFDGPNCCDGSVQTLIIYYNGKRKYLQAMFPPDHALPLLATLRDIYSTAKFERTAQKFEIEYDSIPK